MALLNLLQELHIGNEDEFKKWKETNKEKMKWLLDDLEAMSTKADFEAIMRKIHNKYHSLPNDKISYVNVDKITNFELTDQPNVYKILDVRSLFSYDIFPLFMIQVPEGSAIEKIRLRYPVCTDWNTKLDCRFDTISWTMLSSHIPFEIEIYIRDLSKPAYLLTTHFTININFDADVRIGLLCYSKKINTIYADEIKWKQRLHNGNIRIA